MRLIVLLLLGFLVPAMAQADTGARHLPREVFLDKMRGAWAGQMIGVCFGEQWEFRSNGAPILEDLGEWQADKIACAINQDDVYVEMTFLQALEQHGLDITFEQAGKAFGESQYPLWHANRVGRENIRAGIMPPLSGHPDFNVHADDIDFQIEADIFGILCPGLPQESNRLCGVFGPIMNYGDGVYGGMFVAGMYSAAYFEEKNVAEIVRAGLACIPPASSYHQCISDVIAWHAESPGDWLSVWKKIEEKWQDDVDCTPGNPFNIDAKLNGAYIVMGLLYGEGDILKSIEIATRCGQDADCNPSNAAGILGCMQGFNAMGPIWTSGIEAIAEIPFSHTPYTFSKLIKTCESLSEAVVRRAGGTVTAEGFHIPLQQPKPPATLEQWVNQHAHHDRAISASEVLRWDARFHLLACGPDMEPGLRAEWNERKNVLLLHPVSHEKPAAVEATLQVPDTAAPHLVLEAASSEKGDCLLRLLVDGALEQETLLKSEGAWQTYKLDLAKFRGKEIRLRLEVAANDWAWEGAHLGKLDLK